MRETSPETKSFLIRPKLMKAAAIVLCTAAAVSGADYLDGLDADYNLNGWSDAEIAVSEAGDTSVLPGPPTSTEHFMVGLQGCSALDVVRYDFRQADVYVCETFLGHYTVHKF